MTKLKFVATVLEIDNDHVRDYCVPFAATIDQQYTPEHFFLSFQPQPMLLRYPLTLTTARTSDFLYFLNTVCYFSSPGWPTLRETSRYVLQGSYNEESVDRYDR